MSSVKQRILCNDCGADFEIKFHEEENEPAYCPFCGADLFWYDHEEEDDELNLLDDWDDPDTDNNNYE